MSRTADESPGLPAQKRELLTAVQDRLIPRDGEMPGAGELGGAEVVSGYMNEFPHLQRAILETLEAIEAKSKTHGAGDATRPAFDQLDPSTKDEIFRDVESEFPGRFAVLVTQTYNSYYTNPTIQKILGAGALPPQPHGFEMPDFDESKLDGVKERGKTWRNA